MMKPMTKSSPKSGDFLQLSNVTTYQSGVVQSRAMRRLNQFTAFTLRAHNLTTMEWFIVGTVRDAGAKGMTLTELKNKLGTTMPFITTSVKALLAKNALAKSSQPKDARTKIVMIASGYQPTIRKIEKNLRAEMRKLFYDQIAPEDLRTYVNVLYKISNL